MDASGADVLKSAFDVLKDEGLLTYGTARDRLTVDWVEQQTQEAHLPPLEPAPELSDDDFRVLNRSEEHTSELQSLMRISYAVFCLKKKNNNFNTIYSIHISHLTNNIY